METQMRRCRVTLVTLGTGIILFSAWSIIKTFLLTYAAASFDELDISGPGELLAVKLLYALFVGVFLLLTVGLRLRVGLSARAEGLGKRKKSGYLILAVLIVLLNLAFNTISLYYAFTQGLGEETAAEFVVGFTIDLTSDVLLIEMLLTVCRLRRLCARTEG